MYFSLALFLLLVLFMKQYKNTSSNYNEVFCLEVQFLLSTYTIIQLQISWFVFIAKLPENEWTHCIQFCTFHLLFHQPQRVPKRISALVIHDLSLDKPSRHYSLTNLLYLLAALNIAGPLLPFLYVPNIFFLPQTQPQTVSVRILCSLGAGWG